MIVWMRKHARGLKRELEGSARAALAAGSVLALVAMAFFAVIREGFETAVFLLAAFDASTRPLAAGGGAVLGVARRRRARLRHLPRRREDQPGALLPRHGRRARARRRRPRRQRAAHRARGRLAQQLPGAGARPRLARRARQRPLGAARPACSACSRARSWPRSPATSLYAIPMLLVVLWPRGLRLRVRRQHEAPPAVRQSDEARATIVAVAARAAAAPRCLRRLRLELGRLDGDAAAAPPRSSRTRSRSRSSTPAATRRARPAGRADHLQGRERRRREGHRVRDPRRRPHPRRGREHRAGPVGRVLAHAAAPATTRPYCPGGTTAGARDAEGHGRRSRRGANEGATAAVATYRHYVEQQTKLLERAARRVHRRGQGRRRREGEGARTRSARDPVRARSSRSPRASATSTREIDARDGDVAGGRVDGLPPDRAGALGAAARSPAWARAPTSSLTDVDELRDARRDGPARAGADRERRGRAARRGRRSRRSPARRSATRTPTSSTSRPTSTARRRRSTPLRPLVAESDPTLADDDRRSASPTC